MCRKRNSVTPPPVPLPQQHELNEKEAAAGIMASRRVLKRGVVRRYNARERHERIERYRSKRNRLNFQKKITYTCRKVLAEKRNRIGGRFAVTPTGDEKSCLPEKTDQNPSNNTESVVPEWWPPMEAAMAREEEENSFSKLLQWDWEMLASYLGFNI